MNLNQRLVQKQTQKLVMTQDLRQSIELLPLSTLELADKINQELIENPLLEEDPNSDRSKQPELYSSNESLKIERLNSLKSTENSWQDSYTIDRPNSASGQDAADKKQKYIESSPVTETLADHLLWQLRVSSLDEEEMKIAEILVSMIDSRGFITTSSEEIAAEMGFRIPQVKSVLKVIQELDPIGIGAKDIQESLLIQARILKPESRNLHIMISRHLKDLEKLDYKVISKKMELPVDEIEQMASEIKKLEPYPASLYTFRKTDYVVPDVVVRKIGGEYEIFLNDEWLPKLQVNSEYKAFLRSADSSNDKEYISQKLNSAEWLIRSVNQRRQTLYRVVAAILDAQRDFFEKGVHYLKPLTLREVAEKMEMHESTVSRITTNKYVETSWGILELKWFFSSGVRSTEGGMESSKKIQDIIKNLVKEEPADDPLSDQAIVDLMKKKGIEIARRTVAKYRKALRILPSSQRKKMKSLESK